MTRAEARCKTGKAVERGLDRVGNCRSPRHSLALLNRRRQLCPGMPDS